MQLKTVTPHNVQYNAATNMFEALVTVITGSGQCRYPCAVEGSISMPPSAAAFKRTQQAKSRHTTHRDLRARTLANVTSREDAVLTRAA